MLYSVKDLRASHIFFNRRKPDLRFRLTYRWWLICSKKFICLTGIDYDKQGDHGYNKEGKAENNKDKNKLFIRIIKT